MEQACLYVVATPLGNLADITLRALDVLRDVSVIAAEDTRHSQHLLRHYGIKAKLIALHQHNEAEQSQQIIRHLTQGQSVALISDAGTPCLCDPGFRLVQSVANAGFKVSPMPGPSALAAALSVSGIAIDQFLFLGFLPSKMQARRQLLRDLDSYRLPCICYEAPHRIVDCLTDCQQILGNQRHIIIAREISKTFETILRGSCEELLARVISDNNQQKGEFVLVISPAAIQYDKIDKKAHDLLIALLAELPQSQACRLAAKITGMSKKQLYQYALTLEG